MYNKLDSVKAFVTSKFARQALLTQKHSPQILFVAGAVGVVGTVVLACRATLKTGDILENAESMQNDAIDNPKLNEDNADKISRRVQINAALAITKAYLPAFGLGVLSIGALAGGQIILTKRNGALVAMYIGLDKAFKQYRQSVTDEYGEDVDRKFAGGYKMVSVEEKMADGTIKLTNKTTADAGGSPYAALFDEKSKHFSKMPGANPNTLTMIQSHATDKLRARGHLFLNEVYDMLDLPRTSAGQIVGWVYNSDPNNVDHAGDNYVTFGIWQNDDDFVEAFLDGHEKTIWLDFNVDGPVYQMI